MAAPTIPLLIEQLQRVKLKDDIAVDIKEKNT